MRACYCEQVFHPRLPPPCVCAWACCNKNATRPTHSLWLGVCIAVRAHAALIKITTFLLLFFIIIIYLANKKEGTREKKNTKNNIKTARANGPACVFIYSYLY